MPLRMNSIINNESKKESVFAGIVTKDIQNPDSLIATSDKKKLHITKNIIDKRTGEIIGKSVITVMATDNALEIKDVDIVIKNENPTKLNFLKKLDESSESNEYYHVECENENHFEVETVNRSAIENEIEGQKHEVYVSAFPFELNIYDTIEDANKALGFGKPVKIDYMDLEVSGYSEQFMAPGNTLGSQEACSFIIGTVKTFREVNSIIGEEEVEFIIVQLDTAIGTIPVAVSRDVFDLEKLYAGKIIVMFADIKIDFVK